MKNDEKRTLLKVLTACGAVGIAVILLNGALLVGAIWLIVKVLRWMGVLS